MAVLDPDPPASRAVRGRRAPRRLLPLLIVAVIAVGAVSLMSLASPEPARAIDINPLDPIQDVLGAGVDAITGGIGGMAVEGLGAIIKALFAWPAKIINRELLGWLVAVPDYAIHPETARAGGDGSNLAQLGATTSAMGFAALGAVATVSGIRYWAAGLTGSGGLEALEGLGRTVGAALFIVLWPWLFRHAAELANEAGSGLLGSGRVLDDTARLLAVAFVAGVSFNILAILIAFGAAVLFLALLAMKIAVSATTALVFVAMPLAVMLWPIPELAWIARTAMRAFAVVLAIPLLWAVCFATFAAVGIDALSLKGAGRFVDALVMPLVALALLGLTVTAPRSLARMAMAGAQGGGFAGRTASYLVARRADAAIAQRIPAAVGGRAGGHGFGGAVGPAVAGPAKGARSGRLSGAASTVFGGQRSGTGRRSGATPTAGAPTAADSEPPSPQGRWKPPEGFEQTGAAQGTPGAGLRTPSWREIKDHVPVELAAAAARERSATRDDVARAMRSLSPQARQGVIGLMEGKGGQIRGQMAHQAARGDLADGERDAFRTLAAAGPEVRAQGIGDFLGASERPAGSAPTDGATAPTGDGSATPPVSQAGYGTGGQPSPPTGGEDSSPVAAPLPDGGPMGSARQQPPPVSEPDAGSGSSAPPPRNTDDQSRNVPEPVSFLAGKLASALMSAAAPKLRDRLMGTAEERALTAAFNAAFGAMLLDVPDDDQRQRAEDVAPQLIAIFSDAQVVANLIDVALMQQPPSTGVLLERLWSAGFDPETFPLDPGQALRTLTIRLTEELRAQAEQPGNPLFQQVTLASLDRLYAAVSELGDEKGAVPFELRIGVPPTPTVIVGRGAQLAGLRASLLEHAGADGRMAGLIRVLRGWPGVGKSTVAAAIIHDPDVRDAYPNVLWATVTDPVRVRSQVFGWARFLGIPGDRVGTSLTEVTEQLRALVGERRMLIVIDDVWRSEDALPFRIGGPPSATLITTRLPAVAGTLTDGDDERVLLDPLDTVDSLELIGLLAPQVLADHPEACRALVEELEGLPLALKVAGRLLRVEAELGWGVEELLAELRHGARLLDAPAPADRADVATQTTPSVATLLAQSTDRLEAEDRERFALLGAFAPKPATFDLPAIATLWDSRDPRPQVRTLVARGLLEPLERGRFQMHALLAVHARTLLD